MVWAGPELAQHAFSSTVLTSVFACKILAQYLHNYEYDSFMYVRTYVASPDPLPGDPDT